VSVFVRACKTSIPSSGDFDVRYANTRNAFRVWTLQTVSSLIPPLDSLTNPAPFSFSRLLVHFTRLAPHYEEAATELKSKSIKLAKARLSPCSCNLADGGVVGRLHRAASPLFGLRCEWLPHAQGVPEWHADGLFGTEEGGWDHLVYDQVGRFPFASRLGLIESQAKSPGGLGCDAGVARRIHQG